MWKTFPALCSAAHVDLLSNYQELSLIPRRGWGCWALRIRSAPHWRRPRLSMQTVSPLLQMTWYWHLCGEIRSRHPVPITMARPDWHFPAQSSGTKSRQGTASLCSISGQETGEKGSSTGEELRAVLLTPFGQDRCSPCLVLKCPIHALAGLVSGGHVLGSVAGWDHDGEIHCRSFSPSVDNKEERVGSLWSLSQSCMPRATEQLSHVQKCLLIFSDLTDVLAWVWIHTGNWCADSGL